MVLLSGLGSLEPQGNQEDQHSLDMDNQVAQINCQANQDQAVQVKGNQDSHGDQANLCQLHQQGKDNQVSQNFPVKDHQANQHLRNLDKANQDKNSLDQASQEDLTGFHVLKKDFSDILTAVIGFTDVLTLGTVLWHTNLTAPKVSYSTSGTVLAIGPMQRLLATKRRPLACLHLVVVEDLSLVQDSLHHVLPGHHRDHLPLVAEDLCLVLDNLHLVLPAHRRRRHPLARQCSHQHHNRARLKLQASFRGLLVQ